MEHRDMKKLSQAAKKANEEKFLNHSKQQLERHVEKKFKTTMIGALVAFEKHFGDLWGQDKYEEDLTEEEKLMYAKWEVARTEILNNGNNQKRAILDEVSQYTIKFNKFETKFIIQDKKELL